MNSATPVIDRSDQHDAAQPATDAVPHIAAPFADNPLWMVAIALACLFALLTCLVASG